MSERRPTEDSIREEKKPAHGPDIQPIVKLAQQIRTSGVRQETGGAMVSSGHDSKAKQDLDKFKDLLANAMNSGVPVQEIRSAIKSDVTKNNAETQKQMETEDYTQLIKDSRSLQTLLKEYRAAGGHPQGGESTTPIMVGQEFPKPSNMTPEKYSQFVQEVSALRTDMRNIKNKTTASPQIKKFRFSEYATY
jgi:hypothetical protein